MCVDDNPGGYNVLSKDKASEIVTKAQPGDAIAFVRRVFLWVYYLHYGIYNGQNEDGQPEVLHIFGPNKSQSKVTIDPIDEKVWLDSSEMRIFKCNGQCNRQKQLDAGRKWVGELYGEYHLMEKNCEHFVRFIKGGLNISHQAVRVSRVHQILILLFAAAFFTAVPEQTFWGIQIIRTIFLFGLIYPMMFDLHEAILHVLQHFYKYLPHLVTGHRFAQAVVLVLLVFCGCGFSSHSVWWSAVLIHQSLLSIDLAFRFFAVIVSKNIEFWHAELVFFRISCLLLAVFKVTPLLGIPGSSFLCRAMYWMAYVCVTFSYTRASLKKSGVTSFQNAFHVFPIVYCFFVTELQYTFIGMTYMFQWFVCISWLLFVHSFIYDESKFFWAQTYHVDQQCCSTTSIYQCVFSAFDSTVQLSVMCGIFCLISDAWVMQQGADNTGMCLRGIHWVLLVSGELVTSFAMQKSVVGFISNLINYADCVGFHELQTGEGKREKFIAVMHKNLFLPGIDLCRSVVTITVDDVVLIDELIFLLVFSCYGISVISAINLCCMFFFGLWLIVCPSLVTCFLVLTHNSEQFYSAMMSLWYFVGTSWMLLVMFGNSLGKVPSLTFSLSAVMYWILILSAICAFLKRYVANTKIVLGLLIVIISVAVFVDPFVLLVLWFLCVAIWFTAKHEAFGKRCVWGFVWEDIVNPCLEERVVFVL